METSRAGRPALEIVVFEGLTPYKKARDEQLSLVERRKIDRAPDTLLLVEHEPVITLGLRAEESGVLASAAYLRDHNIDVHRVERGGKTTYHGPGQVVAYPILYLDGLRLGIQSYVSKLEETMILAAGRMGVESYRREGMIGVFCERGKIGAIGVRVTKGVCFHGFAFNVAPDLSHYKLIVPCGMNDIPVTSVAEVLGRAPSFADARGRIAQAFSEAFDMEPRFRVS